MRDRNLVISYYQPSPVGPSRSYYEISEAGRTELASFRVNSSRFTKDIGGILQTKGKNNEDFKS